ncbi:MAG: NAD(P)H-dependent oxidoreductase [Bacillota bacterium]
MRMDEITLIIPECREAAKTKRLTGILEYCLDGCSVKTITRAEEFEPLENKRVLFAINLGESGINLEYFGFLKKMRVNDGFLKGCVGALIVDGSTELYTKAVARELVFCANRSGCTFVGKPLVEATGSMTNFNTLAMTLETDHMGAYRHSAKTLVQQLQSFEYPKSSRPNILTLHASNYSTSNTLSVWKMVEKHLTGCDIHELTLRNGELVDCTGCPYTQCLHLGERGNCFYGGAIVEDVFPAVRACNALVLLCPNYNDAVGANIAAFINRLTSLYRNTRFYDKYLFGVIVSGYSGGDIVAEQLISGLNMNKSFLLPAWFSLLETAHAPRSAQDIPGIEERAKLFAQNMLGMLC